MGETYNHKKIETKWQAEWEKRGVYKTEEGSDRPKCYVLDMFPYPSGEGLHVGHPKGYIATDVYSRMKRMQGFNVLHPMGWDAFGLPAEQYALKNKVHPRIAVEKNIARYKRQLAHLGFNYDWSREVDTTNPAFYKWTQWIFKQLFKKGLAHESHEPINWCPSCKTGLSNEDLDGNACERCGTKVEQKAIRQWVLKITSYADRMLDDLEDLNWPEHIKESQRNWIGRSEGAAITFAVNGKWDHGSAKSVTVFTTRPDTLFGATYLAISAELASKWIEAGWDAPKDVERFVTELQNTEKESSFDYKEVSEKKGIATGITATNPANGETIPVWVANYVLSGYGTGALMAVPAHDERDFDFATKYMIPVRSVISHKATVNDVNIAGEVLPYVDEGVIQHSGAFDGMSSAEAKGAITRSVGGKMTKQYRLKDWVFARQRYWGEPFPIVFDADHKPYVVADTELPVVLPEVESYEPTGTGESPLANITDWVEVYGYLNGEIEFVSCKESDPRAKRFTRETNTMPQWAGSSWYYLRYIDPMNTTELVDKETEKQWSPVDFYVGGAEHATRHLIYARFWHKFLFDNGIVNYPEPFARLQNVGLIMASDGRKMSKRYGNVINPDDIIETYGADSLRIYEMFMGPFGQAISWSTDNLIGARRFVERVWRLAEAVREDTVEDTVTEQLRHQTVQKVSVDIEAFAFNTAIAQMMIFLNHLEKLPAVPSAVYCDLLLITAPFAPHIAEELWTTQKGGKQGESIHRHAWPAYDPKKAVRNDVTIGVQVNGKLRDEITVVRDEAEESVTAKALLLPGVLKWIAGNPPKKVIYISGKIINIIC